MKIGKLVGNFNKLLVTLYFYTEKCYIVQIFMHNVNYSWANQNESEE